MKQEKLPSYDIENAICAYQYLKQLLTFLSKNIHGMMQTEKIIADQLTYQFRQWTGNKLTPQEILNMFYWICHDLLIYYACTDGSGMEKLSKNIKTISDITERKGILYNYQRIMKEIYRQMNKNKIYVVDIFNAIIPIESRNCCDMFKIICDMIAYDARYTNHLSCDETKYHVEKDFVGNYIKESDKVIVSVYNAEKPNRPKLQKGTVKEISVYENGSPKLFIELKESDTITIRKPEEVIKINC